MDCLNWDPSKKVSPFEYQTWGVTNYHFDKASFKILSENAFAFSRRHPEYHVEPIQVINLNHYIEKLQMLDRIEQTELIFEYGVSEPTFYVGEEIEVKFFDKNKPITAYFDYPFKHMIEVKIYPLFVNNTNVGFPVGYLAWQISKIYSTIYQYHWKEAGVWGHALCDLVLDGLNLHKNNIIILLTGS